MHNPLEHHLPNRFPDNQHGRSLAAARMRDLARGLLVPVGLLWIAVLNAGCNEIFGLTPTTLAPPDAYTCGCTCNGGGQSFELNTNVCLPENLNVALNPNLPPDFVPAAADVQADCHTRVEQNLEQMARQCVADRIRWIQPRRSSSSRTRTSRAGSMPTASATSDWARPGLASMIAKTE